MNKIEYAFILFLLCSYEYNIRFKTMYDIMRQSIILVRQHLGAAIIIKHFRHKQSDPNIKVNLSVTFSPDTDKIKINFHNF